MTFELLAFPGELCDHCGKCFEFCEYNAIFVSSKKVLIFPELCHACGGCMIVCPKNAIAEKENGDLILIDGSPGISCPVIASVSGMDVGLAVAEPTMSGIHDLEKALRLLNHFSVTPFMCINTYDKNRNNAEE